MKLSGFSSAALVAVLLPCAHAAEVETAATGGELDQVVVSASRSGDAIPERLIGGSVTLLDAQELDDRGTRVVSDVLRDVPGVSVSRSGGIAGLTAVRIRGTESNHVLVLIDGIKASDPFDGAYDFGTLIADDQAKIEVLRGQQSALYGSDAIGGVIHYITLTGAEAPGVRLRAEGGSFGTGSGSARVAGVQGNLDYALSVSALHTDGTPSAVDGARDVRSDNVGASFKAIYTPIEQLHVTAVGRYSYTNADSNNSSEDPTSTHFGLPVDSPGVFYKNVAYYGLIRSELASFEGHWVNALTVQLANTKRNEYSADERTGGDKGDRTKAAFESTGKFGSDVLKHRVTLALDAERQQFQNLDPSGFSFTGKRHTNNYGLVGEYGVVWNDALSIDASLRHDRNDIFHNADTFRAQASYSLPEGTRLRAAGGSGIKNPEFLDLYGFFDGVFTGNPNLKPEKSIGWEVGVDQVLLDRALTVGLTYFSSRLRDEIVDEFPPPLFIETPVNLTQDTHQRGVELFTQAALGAQVKVDASYTYLHAITDGAEAVRRPSQIASLNVTTSTRDGRGLFTVTARYNGGQNDVTFTDPTFATTPIVRLGSYTLLNLNGEYQVLPHLSVLARLENLAGKRYQEVYGYQGVGRGLYGGIRAQF
jgi:vitamin B12 transporter